MKSVDVCLSPELLHLYELEGKIVVVVDILRATSCMTTALAHGIQSITPVAALEDCKALQQQGYIAAAERNGEMAAGFDLGNSPFGYMDKTLEGKKVAMTTTNGTLAITRSSAAAQIIIGSFLNISAVANYLLDEDNDIIILCAGWKGKVNLEDTLFAGALFHVLKESHTHACDAPLMAESLYLQAWENPLKFLESSSHVQRLKRLGIEKDIDFCLQNDIYDVVPVLRGKELVLADKRREN